jgi:uncharacterized membrane protein
MENHLPPLVEKYGDQLEIAEIEVSAPANYAMYMAALELFDVPPQRQGVPAMFIGDVHLVGTDEIARQLDGLIQKYLEQGGVDYPPIPGLEGALPAATPGADETPRAPRTATPATAARVVENQSPALHTSPSESDGYALAIAIMIGMVAALVYSGVVVARGLQGAYLPVDPDWQTLAIPLLALVGLGVAGYLAYVETRAVPAVCGPVGDCNAVQSSSYARLGGVLPVGVLGAVGYAAILAAWLWGRFRSDGLAEYAPLALFGMALFGTLFSLYLTYLEPFVIHAVCAWCLTSAVIVTLLTLLSINPLLRTMNAELQLRSEGS